jgi:hypothetical protein
MPSPWSPDLKGGILQPYHSKGSGGVEHELCGTVRLAELGYQLFSELVHVLHHRQREKGIHLG